MSFLVKIQNKLLKMWKFLRKWRQGLKTRICLMKMIQFNTYFHFADIKFQTLRGMLQCFKIPLYYKKIWSSKIFYYEYKRLNIWNCTRRYRDYTLKWRIRMVACKVVAENLLSGLEIYVLIKYFIIFEMVNVDMRDVCVNFEKVKNNFVIESKWNHFSLF